MRSKASLILEKCRSWLGYSLESDKLIRMSENRGSQNSDVGCGMISEHDRTAWLKGGSAQCQMPPVQPTGEAWRIVLLGTPDADHGTIAKLICQHLGTCYLSTHDVFCAAPHFHEAELSPATENALDHLHRGEPVSDETVLSLIGERLRCLHCTGGFLLEGFPRTVVQAKALEQLLESHNLKLSAVIHFEQPGESSNRHLDTEFDKLQPLIEFYRQRKQLSTVSATGSPEEIFQRTRAKALLR